VTLHVVDDDDHELKLPHINKCIKLKLLKLYSNIYSVYLGILGFSPHCKAIIKKISPKQYIYTMLCYGIFTYVMNFMHDNLQTI